MNKEDFLAFVDKKVRLIKVSNGSTSYYTGHIKEINEDSILFVDKFEVLLLLDMDEIKLVQTIKDVGHND